MAEDENAGPKPNPAKVDDEFLRHPHSGASIRNPLREKCRSAPILFQEPEFKHNMLDDCLQDYQCITVSEAGFKEMMRTGNFLHATKTLQASGGDPSTVDPGRPPTSPLARAALSGLNKLPSGYEFVVTVRKSSYVPRASRRRQEQKQANSQVIDKLMIEVTDDGGPGLKIEEVREGLVATWNRTNPAFPVRQGDRILRANMVGSARASPQQMIDEIEASQDLVRLCIRRVGLQRSSSKMSVGSRRGSRRPSKASVRDIAAAAAAATS